MFTRTQDVALEKMINKLTKEVEDINYRLEHVELHIEENSRTEEGSAHYMRSIDVDINGDDDEIDEIEDLLA